MAISASSDVTPTSAGALHRWYRSPCVERLWKMDVTGDFTGVGSFGSWSLGRSMGQLAGVTMRSFVRRSVSTPNQMDQMIDGWICPIR